MPEVAMFSSSSIPADMRQAAASLNNVKSQVAHNISFGPLTIRYPERAPLENIEIRSSKAIFDDVDTAVAMCAKAQEEFARTSTMASRRYLIQVLRSVCSSFSDDLAWCTWSETGMGTYNAKSIMQKVASTFTPGVEDLHFVSGCADDGTAVADVAPLGVVASVIPVTNPTAMIVHNSILILAGGNGVVFNPHPMATRCSNRAVAIINEAIMMAGGPACLVASVREPTVSSTQRLLTHPTVAANLVSGGAEVMKACLTSGKRSICAGPGNPPVIVDDSADINSAAKQIVAGAAFDNNLMSSCEKVVFVVEAVIDTLVSAMQKNGAYLLDAVQSTLITQLLFSGGMPAPNTSGCVDPSVIGLDAGRLLEKIGVKDHMGHDTKLIILKADESHPLVWTEQMVPVLPIVAVGSFSQALTLARRCEQGYRHTSSCFTQNLQHMSSAAHDLSTSIFVANGSLAATWAAGNGDFIALNVASFTGEGIIRPSTFVRERKVLCPNAMRCF